MSEQDKGERFEELVEKLRSFTKAYPEDMFGPVSEAERKEHGNLITRVSAGMGRHCGKFMGQAADAIESLMQARAAGGEWQPMETAPKDGAYLVYLEKELMGSRVHATNVRANFKTVGSIFSFDAPKALYWQPLPPPPTEKKG